VLLIIRFLIIAIPIEDDVFIYFDDIVFCFENKGLHRNVR